MRFADFARKLMRRRASQDHGSPHAPAQRNGHAFWNQQSTQYPWRSRVPVYESDNLVTWDKSLDFLADPRFVAAYRRGVNSGHAFDFYKDGSPDPRIEWRVHVACWAGTHAAQLPGDFVECGVNTGIFSLAICDYIDFNATGKSFWLFDTFNGIPDDHISDRERQFGRHLENALFPECYEQAKANFAAFPKARLVRGIVPQSLNTVDIDRVAYLSLDLNVAYPERAAIEHFWPKLVPGAIVLLDDYGWASFVEQKRMIDDFAAGQGVSILNLPTGQGILIKPK
jgi:hypothetical protein